MNLSSSDITITDENIKNLDMVLRDLNVDITSLKKSHILRRIRVRMLRSGFTSFSDYFSHLKSNNEEKSQLQLAFSINVTKFFRNADTFDFLKKEVIPKVINNSKGTRINVWSAGCANGAESHSLAILFENFNLRTNRVKITATDYNYELLTFARRGIYSEEYFDETNPDIIQKYFIKEDSNNYKVKPNIQSFIEFKKHNLVKNRVLSEGTYDLIVCRNVLIYFNRELQPTLFDKFYSALKSQGYLVLGRTESMPLNFRTKFKMINTTHRVFQKI